MTAVARRLILLVNIMMLTVITTTCFHLSQPPRTGTSQFGQLSIYVVKPTTSSCRSVTLGRRNLLTFTPFFLKKSYANAHVVVLQVGQDNGNGAINKWSARFIPTQETPTFVWKPPVDDDVYEPLQSYFFCKLLNDNLLIDKSVMLYRLLKSYYDYSEKDFITAPLLLAYPRRFAKTTLLGFIEALFSPLPMLGNQDSAKLKTKISALERGRDLLDFGFRPVLCLDLRTTSSLQKLNDYIDFQFELAGLDNFVVEKSLSPTNRVRVGVKMLNDKFLAETGVKAKTVVLIDEYDKPFRDTERANRDPLLAELIELFSLGKDDESGISLLILCGLTRMAGTGLSMLNTLSDVSRQTKFHGLCGISTRELVKCANGQLDDAARKKYNVTFAVVLDQFFRKRWNGFRFGLDDEIGWLDPNSADGALYSPLDAWEIVRCLSQDNQEPSSKWIDTMHAEFEFTSFGPKYTSSPEGNVKLYRNLEGGWVDTSDFNFKLMRENYIMLDSDIHVKNVLFELGLLSVRASKGKSVQLVTPNEMVLRNAIDMLLSVTGQGMTTKEQAYGYLSKAGFDRIVSNAATDVTCSFGGVGDSVVNKNTFRTSLYNELYYRFMVKDGIKYKVFKEKEGLLIKKSAKEQKTEDKKGSSIDVGIVLQYTNCPKLAFLVKIVFEKASTNEKNIIHDVHQRNLKKATDQIKSYDWIKTYDTKQWVVVSGVWHPSTGDQSSFMMSSTFWFL